MSRAVQNFPQESAELLNAQVNMELYAAYSYFAMANYCTQDDVALPGLACFFTKSYKEELEHANMLSTYLLKRGGTLTCTDVKAPPHVIIIEVFFLTFLRKSGTVQKNLLKLHLIWNGK